MSTLTAQQQAPADAAHWPRFRGPNSNPVSENPNLPVSWSKTENVEWATDVPGVGWSSPVVWGNRIFITAATSDKPMKQPSLGVDYSNEYLAELRKQGLSAALHSGDPAFDALPGYFVDRLGHVVRELLDAAIATGEVRTDVDAVELLQAIGDLSHRAPAADGAPNPMVRVLLDGLRVRAD